MLFDQFSTKTTFFPFSKKIHFFISDMFPSTRFTSWRSCLSLDFSMISQALNVNSASIICAVGEQGERNAVEFELFDKNKENNKIF